MHPDSLKLMAEFKNKYADRLAGKRLLDVGSQDINGSYRHIFNGVVTEHVGLDAAPGEGVDVVSNKEDVFPFKDAEFDVVISGQTLEHCRRPWNTVKEIARVLKPGGIICLIAPWSFFVHKGELCPLDCWRILDDGMRVLIEDAGLRELEIFSYADDCVGIAEKKQENL
jgi:SAM-dependent methyltransferase